MAYTMTKEDVRKYSREHQFAMLLMMQAAYDYPAARCCLMNGLFSGSILASQAIEKILKTYLHLQGKTDVEIKAMNHNLMKIKQTINDNRNYDLNQYDDIIGKLADSFYHKYPGQDKKTYRTIQLREYEIIDRLWFHLIENLPMPDEVKYRSPIYVFICIDNEMIKQTHGFWMLKNNYYLQSGLVDAIQKYTDVENHLYPSKKTKE